MRSATASILAIGTLLTMATASAATPDAGKGNATTQPNRESKSPGPMTTLGNDLIESLPPIAFGVDQETILEATRNDKPFATSRSTLVSQGTGKDIRYHYSDVSMMRGADRSVIEVQTTGVFTRRFRPEKLEWKIIHQTPTGDYSTTTESVTVGEDEIVRVETDASGKTTEKRFPTPKPDFVYLVGNLFTMLKLEPGQRFILSDLDPETGKLNRRTYKVKRKDDHQLRVSVRKHPSKVETEYYVIQKPGQIMRHTIHDLGITFSATSKTRVLALENALRRPRKPHPINTTHH